MLKLVKNIALRTADTLRYYERIGLIPAVNRTSGDIREYQEEDCRWIEFAKCMRDSGIPVEVLIEYVMLFWEGDKTLRARKALLIDQRQKLAEKIADMQKTFDRLTLKIERYGKMIMPIENELKKPKK